MPPLLLAEKLSEIVNQSRDDWEMIEKVTPTTKELLNFWFDENYCVNRQINFHDWQKQAILNTIYAHEILKVEDVGDMYDKLWNGLRFQSWAWLEHLEWKRFKYPRYCMKMATWTWKTWVLEALVVWQYLNAKAWNERFTKNFMVVAPWLIVYDRLKDAFIWKRDDETWSRVFEKSDFKVFEDLFVPEHLREEMFSFLQSSIVTKDNIWKKITWDGQLILTNWHVFLNKKEKIERANDFDPLSKDWAVEVLDDLFPVKPWIAAGNSLDSLDYQALWWWELEYIKQIPNLVVFNDEAHHLWDDDKDEKKWQEAINYASEWKEFFMQVDFSATPYTQKWKEKQYFPHIIIDYDLKHAIAWWFVKIPVLDKRKEIASLSNADLDFKAERDEAGKVIWLSNGQKVMLEAWLTKLRILEEAFWESNLENNKYPKMMVVCEDTNVVPFVTEFLSMKWYNTDERDDDCDVLEIHSNKKWEIWEEEWGRLKDKLFSIDKGRKPRIIISVLMLREWFDVNNICVIVPLRASASWILLEQTIGRWLRLMRRWEEYQSLKKEARDNVLIKKKEPGNYFDILSIVEHPAFEAFYNELLDWNFWFDDGWNLEWWNTRWKTLWDMVTVELKNWYEEYDIHRPIIINDIEEVLNDPVYSLDNLASYHFWFEQLKRMVPQNEVFISQTLWSWTTFWDYDVVMWIFSAKSYNDFLQKLVTRVTKYANVKEINKRWFGKVYPTTQINLPKLTWVIDWYLRYKLFNQNINYLEDNNWKVLMIEDVAHFVIKEVTRMVIEAQDCEKDWKSEVILRSLSEVEKLNMRENYSIDVAKCIYPKLQYPSNRWELEKNFIEFCDNDWKVEAFCKISEYKHTFLRFRYIRADGIPAYYSPDFVVKTADTIYLVETKWDSATVADENVQRKKKSAINYLNRVNELEPEHRDNRKREYVLLSESRFYTYQRNWGNIYDMLQSAKLEDVKTTLF